MQFEDKRNIPSIEGGFSLVELLVSTVISLGLLLSVTSTLFDSMAIGHDNEVIARTNEAARLLLDYMAYDLKMIGSGMPLGQSGFSITDATLGNAALPLMLTSDADDLSIRLNEVGVSTVLTNDYLPSSSSLSFSVISANNLVEGDMVYISDYLVGGTSGMQATIHSVVGTTVTIELGYLTTPGTTFKSGSLVARVSSVAYNSPVDGSGVVRNAGMGNIVLQPKSTFSIEYLDGSGTALALPLTAAIVKDNLYSVRLTVNVQSDKTLKDGSNYSSTASHVIALRNLITSR